MNNTIEKTPNTLDDIISLLYGNDTDKDEALSKFIEDFKE